MKVETRLEDILQSLAFYYLTVISDPLSPRLTLNSNNATDRTDSSRRFVLLSPYDPPTVWTNEHIKLITLRKGGKGAP